MLNKVVRKLYSPFYLNGRNFVKEGEGGDSIHLPKISFYQLVLVKEMVFDYFRNV